MSNPRFWVRNSAPTSTETSRSTDNSNDASAKTSISRTSLPARPSPKNSLPPTNRIASFDDASRYKVMIKYLYAKVSANHWLPSKEARHSSLASPGVLLRRGRGEYYTEPEHIDDVLLNAVVRINAEVAFTMATETTHVIFSSMQQYQPELLLPGGAQLQVVDSLSDIARFGKVKKFQYAALVRRERILLVWHDEMDRILHHAAAVEEKLLALIWGTSDSPFALLNKPASGSGTKRHSTASSPAQSIYAYPIETEFSKDPDVIINQAGNHSDEEKCLRAESLQRHVVFTSSVFVGMAMFLILTMLLGFGVSNIVFECFTDRYWPRIALAATEPFFFVLSIFFFVVIFTNIFQAIGPITSLKTNSRFYSAIKPNLSQAYATGFSPPHVTIQMPVYKESLKGVIIPTVTSLKIAISFYESHGGTASILVNDDGLAYLSEQELEERVSFYHDNNIGWVARPKHNEDGYIRKGKFKKASNMNFALNVSNRVEEHLCQAIYERLSMEKNDMTAHEESLIYKDCLARVLESDSRVKAEGNIRIGEHILIVDCDTRIPVDCLLYGAAEMFLSPEVAIVQHSAGVMQVAWDYFENGITYFTNLIYSSVRFAVGSGEVAAFVGHNAFLRWQALQAIGVPDDGYVAYWSENHVSEDFDIALRLQTAGNVIRMAAYHGDEFKEGVSLTIYDELTRWEKYAYGCNELVCNPVITWLWRGPFTRRFLKFLVSDMQLSSKLTVIGYISTYYAIAAGLPLTILNYFLIGWFNGWLDKFYLESWKVFLSLVIVFSVFGNCTLAILRYRLAEKSLLGALIENFKWMPMFTIFFSGLPFHMFIAIFCHAFSINKSWGSTAKEKEESNFFKEVPKIFRRFWAMYVMVFVFVGGMLYLGIWAPRGWDITTAAAVVPMAVMTGCHALVPFVLNPNIMVFNY